jgi:hypothetical protein
VLARRPAGSLLIAARDVPYAWRLFRGATEATAYAAPRLRFAPACRAKSSAGSDGGREGLSSVRSRAARIRDFEGPDPTIVGEARKERPRRFGVFRRVLSIQTRPWRGFPTLPLSRFLAVAVLGSCSPHQIILYFPSDFQVIVSLQRMSSQPSPTSTET